MEVTITIDEESRALARIERSLDVFPAYGFPSRWERKVARAQTLMPGWVPAWDRPGAMDPLVPVDKPRSRRRVHAGGIRRRGQPRMGEGRTIQGRDYVPERTDECPW